MLLYFWSNKVIASKYIHDKIFFLPLGVRFQFIDGKLRFQIYSNEFDWKTGIVYQNKGKYIYNDQGGK